MNTTYTLIVRPTQETSDLSEDDAALIGTYAVTLMGVEAHAEGDLADAILGAFHDTYGVDNVDDLELCVFNERGQAVFTDLDSAAPDDVDVDDPVWVSDATDAPVPTA